MTDPTLDGGDVAVIELEVGGSEDRIDLVGSAETDDGAIDGRVAQRRRRCRTSLRVTSVSHCVLANPTHVWGVHTAHVSKLNSAAQA
jgi:hypothetical protein